MKVRDSCKLADALMKEVLFQPLPSHQLRSNPILLSPADGFHIMISTPFIWQDRAPPGGTDVKVFSLSLLKDTR